MSARKIGLLILLLGFGAAIETAWQVRGDWHIGPEGCRVIGGRFYGPSHAFEQAAERALPAGEAPRLEVRNAFGGVRVTAGAPGVVKVKLRKVVFLPTEEKARAFADRVELRLSGEGARVKVGTNRDEISRGEDVGLETHLEIEAPPTPSSRSATSTGTSTSPDSRAPTWCRRSTASRSRRSRAPSSWRRSTATSA